MAVSFPIKNGKLQSNLNAAGFTITGMNLSGLGLTNASVGLGNVQNYSAANLPLSSAATSALAGKEPSITAGTTAQYWRGDKSFQTLGALALLNGATTIPLISVIGSSSTGTATLSARRSDGTIAASIKQFGASSGGTVLTTVNDAGVGLLEFTTATNAVIKTTTSAPIIFGTSGIERARILLGLSVGNTTDPGVGGIRATTITATGTITAAQFVGGGAALTGFTASQIPTTLLATTVPSLTISGTAGAGVISLGAQATDPTGNPVKLYATTAGRLGVWHSGSAAQAFEFDNLNLTAKRNFAWPNQSGTIAVGNPDTGWTAWTGTPSKATKLVSTATAAECAAAIKQIIDTLLQYGILAA